MSAWCVPGGEAGHTLPFQTQPLFLFCSAGQATTQGFAKGGFLACWLKPFQNAVWPDPSESELCLSAFHSQESPNEKAPVYKDSSGLKTETTGQISSKTTDTVPC